MEFTTADAVPMHGGRGRQTATPSMHWHILMHYSMDLPDLDADWLMLSHTRYCG